MKPQPDDPTPAQEAMYQMQCEIDGLKEQVADAAKFCSRLAAWEDRYEGKVLCFEADKELHELLREAREFIYQNEQIAKEASK